uniref:C2H2-type domain-containing protein n=1 Tax=Parastrongyloides trichosuri TaxID=131310 RepID=A0A0N4ZG59_PARTI
MGRSHQNKSSSFSRKYSSSKRNSYGSTRTCKICKNLTKSFTQKEYDVHCVSIAHIINLHKVSGNNFEQYCTFCKFETKSKDDMINHVNTSSHEENVERCQKNYKSFGDNYFSRKRTIVKGYDAGIIVPTKCHGFYRTPETLKNLCKKPELNKGDIHVGYTLHNEIINIDDDGHKISAPRCTVKNNRNLPGIRENFSLQIKKDDTRVKEKSQGCSVRQAIPKKLLTSKDNKITENVGIKNDIILVKEIVRNNLEVPFTSNDSVQAKSASQFLNSFDVNSSENSVSIETYQSFLTKYGNCSQVDLMNYMKDIHTKVLLQKNKMEEAKRVYQEAKEEYRFLINKITENYKKSV